MKAVIEAAGRRRNAGARAARLLLGAWAVLLAGGCSGRSKDAVPAFGPEGDFQAAVREFERGDMAAAIAAFETFERNHPGSQYIDDALFYLGRAHQTTREYLLARQAFERLAEDFPRSPFVEDAHFEIAHSWYLAVRGAELDAEPAEEALRSYRTYLRRYPEGKHRAQAEEAIADLLGTLARKSYLNGQTYMRLGRPEAARRYFEKSLEIWEQAPVSAQALAGIARSYEKEMNWAEARRAYERLAAHLGEQPDRFADGKNLAGEARKKLASLPAGGD